MRVQKSVSALPASLQRRFWILGAVLASFIVFSVVFSVVVWIKITSLQRVQLRLGSQKGENSSENLAHAYPYDGDDNDDTDLEHLLGISVSEGDSELASERSRRRSKKKWGGDCQGCCRDCDCFEGKGVKRNEDTKDHKCKVCCRRCRLTKICLTRTFRELVSGVFRPQIGHFIGVHSSKAKGNRGCSTHRENSRNGPALTTEVGLVCYWKYPKWMEKEARRLYKLDWKTGKVTVRDAGLYLVFAHITRNETMQVARQALVTERHGHLKEIATCSDTAGYSMDPSGEVIDPAGSFRTCSMTSLVKLKNGTNVYLGVYRRAVTVPFDDASEASFGIIKY